MNGLLAHFRRFTTGARGFWAVVAAIYLCASLPHTQAQVDPVYNPPAPGSGRPMGQALPTSELARTLYNSLIDVENPEAVAGSLSQLARYAGLACTNVTDFQVIFRGSNEQRLKLKCPGRPLYGMTITRRGTVTTYGGDGMVGDFNAANGTIFGITATSPVAVPSGQRLKPDFGPSGNLPGSLQGENTEQLPVWLVTLIIVSAFMIIALLLSFAWFMRSKMQPEKPKPPKEIKMSSAEKDSLIIESREVLPHIYHHPDGMFIARGRRGKRRMFGNLFFAILYRDYGLKLREKS